MFLVESCLAINVIFQEIEKNIKANEENIRAIDN